jgi:ligand-binding sensor domain-containing protein
MQVRFGHIILALLAAVQAASQQSEFQFRHVTDPDGLTNHFVNHILRDRKGGIWLATHNRLAYYDGAHFSEFLHSRDTNSIINNGVNTLAEDQHGNIWGGTQNGIFCYLRDEQRFRNYYMPAPMERNAWNMVCDNDGTVWINGWIGLAKLDTKTQRFDTALYYQATPQGREMLEMRRNCMLNDPSGKGLWLATRTGLKYFQKSSGRIEDARSHPIHQLFNRHRITALCQTNAHRFWFFDNDTRELVCFDPAKRLVLKRISLRRLFSVVPALLPSNRPTAKSGLAPA